VQPEDSIHFIGDFTRHSAKPYLDRINCRYKHLILGNHDRPGSGKYFTSVHQYREIGISGHECILFHYPIAYWQHAEKGSLHLHGHVHDWYPNYMGNQARALDVSVDTALRFFGDPEPFSEKFILKYMLAREGHASLEGRPKL
jgi:calcineurin-like phosphoesterase family protein